MLTIALVSFVTGAMFVLAGAWPVLGFLSLDAVLIYFAFKANYRAARAYETIKLTREYLLVARISPSGKVQRWKFDPYWLKITIDLPVNHDTQLVLGSHGKYLEIGSFLTPREREEVARALQEQLKKLRQPERLSKLD
tara:strand:- start:15209 stop:15622 length:414 start_codon:yes stop_codon:yes gene_type:complete